MQQQDNNDTEHAIRTIYRQHFKDVYHFIVSFTNNQDEAEDLTQEVFIRLFKSLPTFQGESGLRTYIFSIARNVAVDHYRKVKRRMILGEVFTKFIPASGKNTEEIVEQRESISEVHTALNELKPKYRLVIILRGINEFSICETAKIMRCSETNVKVTYHRALKHLREKLEQTGKWETEGWVGKS